MDGIIKTSDIQHRIYTIRGMQVMLDRDLEDLYQTETRVLKQAVKRNIDRFPSDFMFELDNSDIDEVVSQSVIPSKSYFGGSTPFAFTEQGVSMLSAVIRTSVAVEVSLKIIRTFVELRKLISLNAGLFQRLETVERKQIETDERFEQILKHLKIRIRNQNKGYFTMDRYLTPICLWLI